MATRASAEVFDHPRQLVGPVTVEARKANELARALDHEAAPWRAGDSDASAAAELEQALVAQLPERTKDRVLVHAEDRGKVARGREPLARLGLAFRDRAPDLRCDLLVELGRFGPVDVDTKNGASNNSSTS